MDEPLRIKKTCTNVSRHRKRTLFDADLNYTRGSAIARSTHHHSSTDLKRERLSTPSPLKYMLPECGSGSFRVQSNEAAAASIFPKRNELPIKDSET
jgi:hypothetical protein